jgi:hypothetical protein
MGGYRLRSRVSAEMLAGMGPVSAVLIKYLTTRALVKHELT